MSCTPVVIDYPVPKKWVVPPQLALGLFHIRARFAHHQLPRRSSEMALLDILALLEATSIYRGAIIHIGNAPRYFRRTVAIELPVLRYRTKLMTRRIARCGSCWHP